MVNISVASKKCYVILYLFITLSNGPAFLKDATRETRNRVLFAVGLTTKPGLMVEGRILAQIYLAGW